MEALMISISGTRGTIGWTRTRIVVTQMISAIAAYLKDHEKPANGKHFKIVLGRDTRPSGQWVRDASVASFTASGFELIDLGVVTTPGVNMMIKHLHADAGIVLTASHNPVMWNGIKFLNRNGAALPLEASNKLRKYYDEKKNCYARVENLIPPSQNSDTNRLHVERVLQFVDAKKIADRKYKVVLDSVNGAGGASG